MPFEARSAEEFLTRSRELHGDKYDYRLVESYRSRSQVPIICPHHGRFEQVVSQHLKGHGCRSCAAAKSAADQTQTLDQFLSKCRKVHGDRYDYSLVSDYGYGSKATIICATHGPFQQLVHNHLAGRGCVQCPRAKRTKSLEGFLRDARKVHGDIYDYSDATYASSHVKLSISCRTHGPFECTPANHLGRESGCPKCAELRRNMDQPKFISKCRHLHGDSLDFSAAVYTGWCEKVEVICPRHGKFCIRTDSLFKGAGCKQCKRKGGYSTAAFSWLEDMERLDGTTIQHAANDGEYSIAETRFRADGYSANLNKIYEYQGDYHHGNPRVFKDRERPHRNLKMCMGELYDRTRKRQRRIEDLGYQYEEIWEDEWEVVKHLAKLQASKENDTDTSSDSHKRLDTLAEACAAV